MRHFIWHHDEEGYFQSFHWSQIHERPDLLNLFSWLVDLVDHCFPRFDCLNFVRFARKILLKFLFFRMVPPQCYHVFQQPQISLYTSSRLYGSPACLNGYLIWIRRLFGTNFETELEVRSTNFSLARQNFQSLLTPSWQKSDPHFLQSYPAARKDLRIHRSLNRSWNCLTSL